MNIVNGNANWVFQKAGSKDVHHAYADSERGLMSGISLFENASCKTSINYSPISGLTHAAIKETGDK